MKLQKRVNRRVGDKEYIKWYVDLPADIIEKMKWKSGDSLAVSFNRNKLVIEPAEKD